MSNCRGIVLVAVAMMCCWGCDQKKEVEPAEGTPSTEGVVAKKDATMKPPDQKVSMGTPEAGEPLADTGRITLPDGEVGVVALEHGTFYLMGGENMLIAVDPTTKAMEKDKDPARAKADVILLTDIHADHLDPEAVEQVRGENTIVIAPQAVVDKAGDKIGDVMVMANGDEKMFVDDKLGIRATPMYNIKRSPEGSEEPFHVKGRGNGYVLSLKGGKIYISGDTECTPEMKALEGVDAAFITMNLPYTMPPEEAAECIRAFKPKAIYPYHYRGQDPSKLNSLLGADSGVQVRLLEWYPGGEEKKED